MFFRIKPSGERRYLQIVENTRDGAATRQRVVATLGRVEDLEASGRHRQLNPNRSGLGKFTVVCELAGASFGPLCVHTAQYNC